MSNYDSIVVLASEIFKEGNEFKMPDFYNGVAQGGKIRLDAGIKMFQDKKTKNIIVVGGKVSGSEDEKTDVMADYLIENNIPSDKIIKIPSATNTQGNAAAVKKYMIDSKIKNQKIGLLTSFYHLPRAMKIFAREGLSFEPIVAESILIDHQDYGLDKIHQFYINTKMLERLNQELLGLADLEKGIYKPKTS